MSGFTYEPWQHPRSPNELEIRAFLDGALAGGVRLRLDLEPGILTLTVIRVKEEHRGKGVAKELHARAVAEAHRRGLRLKGTEQRNPAYSEVWEKMRAQREAMETEDGSPGTNT